MIFVIYEGNDHMDEKQEILSGSDIREQKIFHTFLQNKFDLKQNNRIKSCINVSSVHVVGE